MTKIFDQIEGKLWIIERHRVREYLPEIDGGNDVAKEGEGQEQGSGGFGGSCAQ